MPEPFRRHSPNVRRLFVDHERVEREYFASTGIFPIMHTIVIRRDFYEAHRWIAQSLMKAFGDAQRHAYTELAEMTALKVMLPWLPAHVEQTRARMQTDDWWPYGFEANRKTLEKFLRYSHEQGLLPERLAPEALFAAETLKTAKV